MDVSFILAGVLEKCNGSGLFFFDILCYPEEKGEYLWI